MISIDDFYVTSANLATIETTIGNANAELWKYVTPQLNSYWVRIQVANRLASNGVEWAKWFSQFNSGTYEKYLIFQFEFILILFLFVLKVIIINGWLSIIISLNHFNHFRIIC